MDPHVEEHEEGGVAAPHPLQEDPADQSKVRICSCDHELKEMSTGKRKVSQFIINRLKDLC